MHKAKYKHYDGLYFTNGQIAFCGFIFDNIFEAIIFLDNKCKNQNCENC